MFEAIIYEKNETVAVITLNSPKTMNAFSYQLISELNSALDLAAEDDSVRTVVIKGGEKVFAAGGDIAGMLKMVPLEASEYSRTVQSVLNKIERLEKPVIAAISGLALGGGCELAMACDIRLASSSAKFGQPEIDLGIMPGAGATKRLARLVGPGAAKELILTGRVIDAAAAAKMGLVNQVFEDAELNDEAMKMAKRIAAKPAVAVKFIKETINTGMDLDVLDALENERKAFSLLFSTADKKEGMLAFMEKRKPQYQGK
ncbi:MAG: hypothetical protein HPY50_06220 [Firmicutes bacterium]|nr:hypothetical protein [Bacillota bacterium]